MFADDLIGNWEIDDKGKIKPVPFPESEPSKEDIQFNQYALFIYTGGLFKKKVQTIQISILNSKPRNKKFEKQLIPYVRYAIQQNIKPEILDQSGGIETLIKKIEWLEWW